ncbi:MAG: SprT family zinc-dependent metalloprotease [Anaerolineales bacterium]
MPVEIDQLIRSKRKTISLIIQRDGLLIVRAPLRASEKSIREIVAKKEAWIRKTQEKMRAAPPPPQRNFQDGGSLPLLGKPIPLKIIPGQRATLTWVDEHRLELTEAGLPYAATLIERWYKARASEHFRARTAQLAEQFHLTPASIRISSARSRWGSCSGKNNLSFTWRLVMAPPDVADYVILHELAHIAVKNHSPQFWAKVASMMPDYAQKRKWLKEHGRELDL